MFLKKQGYKQDLIRIISFDNIEIVFILVIKIIAINIKFSKIGF